VSNGTATITARSGSAAASAAVTVMDDSQDREALTALYNSTDGSNWTNYENWLSDRPLGEWHGVTTDSDGRVTELDLSENNLQGSLTPELANLGKLRRLFLDRNNLEGIIPPELGRLSQLQGLNLSVTGLSGPIPAELGNLSAMKHLVLRYNQLTGPIPPELGKLALLRTMLLHDNKLTGSIPPELFELAQLEDLDLLDNQLTGPIPPKLGELVELRRLALYGNQFTGPIPLEILNLSMLEDLDLANNKLTGPIPPEFEKLDRLERLSLWGNRLTGSIPPELGNLRELEFLTLASNELSGSIPPEFGNLGNLIWLGLGDNNLEGSIPLSFLRLNKLESLGCRETRGACLPATIAFREWARQVEARGEVDFPVDIPYCDEIDRQALTALYESANGEGWTRSDGWLEDVALDRWHGVQTDSIGRASVLDLSGNRLSGSIPDALGLLGNLKELRLGDNALSGRLPLSLIALPLETFEYNGTSLCISDDVDFEAWLDGISSHSGNGVRCAPLTEREILTSLYWSLGGPRWTNSAGWLTDAPLSAWHGVETDGAGRVIAIQLSRNGLSGALSSLRNWYSWRPCES
jgi:Leucine-rich repeat (LRR) protein